MADFTKVIFILPNETLATLGKLAEERGATMTDAIRYAIETLAFVEKKQASGAKFLIEEPGSRRLMRVVFAYATD